MRSHPASHLIIGCIGGVLGWIAHSTLHGARNVASSVASSGPPAQTPTPAAEAAEPEADAHPSSRIPVPQQSQSPSTRTEETHPETEGAPLDLLPTPSTDAAAATAVRPAKSDLTTELAKSVTIWCKFDPGNGAHLRDGKISMYELAYQGGPIAFDSIDTNSGTARMTGSEGATGSLEGVVDVLATATRAGLHFSAINSRGELVLTTVFGPVDKQGRHPAVMTTHGLNAFDGSFQAYGSCDTPASNSPRPAG